MIELRAGAARLTFDETHGGRVERLTVDRFDLLVPPELDDHNYGMFPMAPWAGRIRHGRFAFDGVMAAELHTHAALFDSQDTGLEFAAAAVEQGQGSAGPEPQHAGDMRRRSLGQQQL